MEGLERLGLAMAVAITRLSCHRFRANEVRLWLSVIADNPGNLWRRLVLPLRIGAWSLTGFSQTKEAPRPLVLRAALECRSSYPKLSLTSDSIMRQS